MEKKEKGTALITSIMSVILVLGLLAACLTLVTNEGIFARYHYNSVQATYLAEAGAERAIAQLKANSTWSGVGTEALPIALGSGGYWVAVTSNGQNRTVISNGRVGSITKQVEFTVQVGGGSSDPIFAYGIFGSKSISIGNHATVNGNVASRGTISTEKHAKVNGTKTQGSTLSPPTLNEADYNNGSAKTLPAMPNNSKVTLTGGVYFVNGSLDIGNNVNIDGKGTVYVKGSLEISNNVNINGTVAFLVTEDLILKQGANFNGGVLFSKKNITLNENSQVWGSVVAEGTITVDNNAEVNYNSSLVNSIDLKLPGSGSFKINDWKYN